MSKLTKNEVDVRRLCLVTAFLATLLAACASSATLTAPELLSQADLRANSHILRENEFAEIVIGKNFSSRELGGNLVIVNHGEYFYPSGRYSTGWRVVHEGTYKYEDGIVLIEGAPSFHTLSNRRVFFRYGDRIFTGNDDGRGPIFELLPTTE